MIFFLIFYSGDSDEETTIASEPHPQLPIGPFVQNSVTSSSQHAYLVNDAVDYRNVSNEQEHNLVVPNHPQSVMSKLSSLCKAEIFTDALICNDSVLVKVNVVLFLTFSRDFEGNQVQT